MVLKKILKNKIMLSIFIIIDLILLFLIMMKTNFYIACIYTICIHFILLYIFLIITVNINLLNFNKVINFINNKKIRKKLNKEDIYLKKIDIKTFDGTGSLTHPSTIYFEKGFKGYKFWMVYTPYDNNNVELENPCIAVSNDGENWEEPKGLKNPLLPIIKKQKPNTYYNDPFLLYSDKLEIWYRHTIEDKELIDNIYRITSYDGINWSNPEKMIEHDKSGYLSLSILKKDEKYYLYYFNTKYEFNLRTSHDLKNWSEEYKIKVKNYDGNFWHGEVKSIGSKVYLLFIDKNYNLYYAETHDLKSFYNCKKMMSYYCAKSYLYSNINLYKSSFLLIKGNIFLYIPFCIKTMKKFKITNVIHKKWEITLTKINKNNLDIIFKKEGRK